MSEDDSISIEMTARFQMFNHTKLPPPPKFDGTIIRYRSKFRQWSEQLKKWV